MQAKQNSEPEEELLPLAADWPSDWLRAALGLCTLQALEPGSTYGYAIINELAAAGLGKVKGGTLYPLLTRFETAGWVQVEWRPGEQGPGRKYFALTEAGHQELARQRKSWHAFANVTTTFLVDGTKN